MKKILLLALPVLAAAAMFGSVTAANATPVSRANAVRSAQHTCSLGVLLQGPGLTVEVREVLH